jgi:hypothetical protein
MLQMRLGCCTGLGESCSMEAPGDAVRLVLQRSESTAGGREKGTGWNAVVAAEELAADDAVDEQCSRVEVVADGAEVEDPAARGGDDAL